MRFPVFSFFKFAKRHPEAGAQDLHLPISRILLKARSLETTLPCPRSAAATKAATTAGPCWPSPETPHDRKEKATVQTQTTLETILELIP